MATPTAPRTPDPLTEVLPELAAAIRARLAKERADALIAGIREHFAGDDGDHLVQRHAFLDDDHDLDYTARRSEATS